MTYPQLCIYKLALSFIAIRDLEIGDVVFSGPCLDPRYSHSLHCHCSKFLHLFKYVMVVQDKGGIRKMAF